MEEIIHDSKHPEIAHCGDRTVELLPFASFVFDNGYELTNENRDELFELFTQDCKRKAKEYFENN